jgi:hypothetical protein
MKQRQIKKIIANLSLRLAIIEKRIASCDFSSGYQSVVEEKLLKVLSQANQQSPEEHLDKIPGTQNLELHAQ